MKTMHYKSFQASTVRWFVCTRCPNPRKQGVGPSNTMHCILVCFLKRKDVKKEVITSIKFQKDSLIKNLKLVPREEFEILKKIIEKQEKEIQKLNKILKVKKAKRS